MDSPQKGQRPPQIMGYIYIYMGIEDYISMKIWGTGGTRFSDKTISSSFHPFELGMIHHSCRFWRTFNGHMTPIPYGFLSLGHFRVVLISTVFSGHRVIATVMPYKIDACVLPMGVKLVQIVVSSCQIGGASRAFATAKHVYVFGELCCYCICCQQCLHLIVNHNLLLKSLTSCSIHIFFVSIVMDFHGICMVQIQIFMGFSWDFHG